MSYSGHFDLDIPRALHAQLIAAFDALKPEPLARLPELDVLSRIGVYGLFLNGSLVYVGKAGSLSKRLTEHHFKIRGRRNLSDEEVGFACLTVNPNWAAYAPEEILIRHFRREGLCTWDGSSFGSHDPGRPREETNKPAEGFDQQFPIRADWPCDWLDAGTYPIINVLTAMKGRLPYLLRYQTSAGRGWRKGHVDFDGRTVEIPERGLPASEVLRRVAAVLPGWQATVFPSHVILYRESRSSTENREATRTERCCKLTAASAGARRLRRAIGSSSPSPRARRTG